MAIYHFTAKYISRGKGQSAIAAAAYRSGERLYDTQTGGVRHYEAHRDRILFTDIMAPADAPEWAHDRNRLWNEAERAEKRKDAQLAREIEVSLPHELTAQQREWLVRDFAREAFVRKGYAVDISIHAPYADADERNHHAHLMITRRTLGPEGFAPTKDWQFDKAQLGREREQWANLANRHLERHGHQERIDHRSLEAQGVDREPTIHLGYAANEMQQRGAASDRAADHQGILERNEMRIQLKGLDAMIAVAENEVTMSRAAAEKNAVWQQLADANRADDAALGEARQTVNYSDQTGEHVVSAERGFAEAVYEDSQTARQEGRDEWDAARQASWREDVEEYRPKGGNVEEGQAPVMMVFDAGAGIATKLGDFMTDFLASSATTPERPEPDMRTLLNDPAARREYQLAQVEARNADINDRKALDSMRQDMEAGRNLKSEDISRLTRQHQEQIRTFGDDAVRQMVDEARKRANEYWQGRERE